MHDDYYIIRFKTKNKKTEQCCVFLCVFFFFFGGGGAVLGDACVVFNMICGFLLLFSPFMSGEGVFSGSEDTSVCLLYQFSLHCPSCVWPQSSEIPAQISEIATQI